MKRRVLLHGAVLGLVAGGCLAWDVQRLSAAGCELMWTTGYVRSDFSNRTADGTSIYADLPIAAAHPRFPFGTQLEVQGVGLVEIHDRGALGWSDLDVAVWDRASAFALTGWRLACPL